MGRDCAWYTSIELLQTIHRTTQRLFYQEGNLSLAQECGWILKDLRLNQCIQCKLHCQERIVAQAIFLAALKFKTSEIWISCPSNRHEVDLITSFRPLKMSKLILPKIYIRFKTHCPLQSFLRAQCKLHFTHTNYSTHDSTPRPASSTARLLRLLCLVDTSIFWVRGGLDCVAWRVHCRVLASRLWLKRVVVR